MINHRLLLGLQRFFAAYESKTVTKILAFFLWVMAAVAVALVALWAVRDFYRIGWNLTESLPEKLFVVKVGEGVLKGDYVAFEWRPKTDTLANPYPSGVMFIKIVAGVPGDKIDVENREVFVNGKSVGFAKEKSRTGLPLNPTQPGIVPEGSFYVMGLHRDSLDSRYELVGNVENINVIGRARPVF